MLRCFGSPARSLVAGPVVECGSGSSSRSVGGGGRRDGPWAAVGLSGGVDSAVAAALMLEAGWNGARPPNQCTAPSIAAMCITHRAHAVAAVVGVHCVSWDEKDETGFCAGEAELADAREAAVHLGVELIQVDRLRLLFNHRRDRSPQLAAPPN